MKLGHLNTIYAQVFVLSLAIALPLAFVVNHTSQENLVAGRRALEKQTGLEVLNGVTFQSVANPAFFSDIAKKAIEDASLRHKDFLFLNVGKYELVSRSADGRSFTFGLRDKYTENILDQPPAQLPLTREDLADFGRPGSQSSLCWIPVPDASRPDQLFLLTLRDVHVKEKLAGRETNFWLISVAAFFLFYAALGAGLFYIFKKPLHRLQSALVDENSSIESLEPEEFGDFGDLVQALNVYIRRQRAVVAAAENVDPVTGFLSGQSAVAAYLETHKQSDEIYAAFFRSNFAKEYVKAFGRIYRDQILKILATAVSIGLPPGTKIYAVQDHFLMTLITDGQFQQSFPAIHRHFSRAVQPLYLKHGDKSAPMMTLSAAAVSNRSVGYEVFQDLLQKLHDDWGKLVNTQLGGWALMNADDQWVKGVADEDGAGEPEIVPEEPESLKDPTFARKVFIVKLAFMFNFDPQKAVKLYKLGYTRLPALLTDGVPEAVKKFGLEADVRQLVEKMRPLPKKRLYYNDSDFKQVFITDVRMVRKIPRESVSRWFAAGFRRLEDLSDMDADSLLKIDGGVGREDIQAVIDHAKTQPPAAALERKD